MGEKMKINEDVELVAWPNVHTLKCLGKENVRQPSQGGVELTKEGLSEKVGLETSRHIVLPWKTRKDNADRKNIC